MSRFVLLVFTLFVSISCWADIITNISVTDGDTIRATMNGQSVRIRLQCIDAPERNQAYGSQATSVLRSLLRGTVDFVQDDVDRYGRRLGYLYVNGRDINREMVYRGAAWNYEYYCGSTYASEQRSAYYGRRGLWAGRNPISPYCFRSGRNNASCYYNGE